MAQRILLLRRLVVLFVLLGWVGSASAAPVMAQPLTAGTTIKVTIFTDDNARNGNCTLREAIQAANVNRKVDRCPAGSGTQADTILLGEGTYVLSVAGMREDANFTGDFDIGQSVNILGLGIDKTIIDAQQIDRAFDNRSASATLRLKDLTIQNGRTGTDGFPDNGGGIANAGTLLVTRLRFLNNGTESLTEEKGGAVYNAGYLELTDALFESNSSDVSGGALGNRGSVRIWRTTFSDNLATVGAAIHTAGSGAKMEIRDSIFTGNHCGPGNDSAIHQGSGASLSILNTLFDQNTCDGAVIGNRGALTIRYSAFTNNRIEYESVIQNYEGSLALTHSLLTGNAGSQGGAVLDVLNGNVVIDRVTIDTNAYANIWVRGGTVRAANSTFSGGGPGTTGCAAGICVQAGALSLESVTVASNLDGALAVQGGSASLHNTILANSANASGAPVADCQSAPGTLVSAGYNLVGRSDGCNWTPAAGDQLGTNAAPIDPLLDALKNNGGPTPTRALLPGSPAINAADPANTVKTDQRIYQRPAGPRSDIGAFEANAVPAQ